MKRYERYHRSALAGALICALFSDLFAVILQFFKGDVLDCAIAGDAGRAVQYGLLLIGSILCDVLLYFCYRLLSAKFVVGCTKALKSDIFKRILAHSYVSYKERPQGEYLAKYTSEADTIKARRFSMLPLLWEILFKIFFVSVALLLLDARIALVTILLLTTPLYVPKIIEKRLQRAQADHLSAAAEALSNINDWLSGFEIIKNFNVEGKIMDRFRRSNDHSMDTLSQDMRLGAVSQLITTLLSYLSYFVVLVCAAWLVLTGDFSAGDFFVAVGMIDQLSYPLISLADIIRQLVMVRSACASMEEFLQTPPAARPGQPIGAFHRDIRFQDVTFAYDAQRPVLRHFDLTIRKGGRYLLKGPSGCGKTTAINLLLRYYDVSSGSIEIDGTPIKHTGSAYDYLTVVRQEAVLFHDTLRNNLTMYRDLPDHRLTAALESLGLGKYACPEALDRMVTEGGANFSGGEKKRICLARALLRDTDVLILDEPLANLDSGTAGRIEDLLLSIRDKTLLVVSHQFSEEKLGQFDLVLDLSPAQS